MGAAAGSAVWSRGSHAGLACVCTANGRCLTGKTFGKVGESFSLQPQVGGLTIPGMRDGLAIQPWAARLSCAESYLMLGSQLICAGGCSQACVLCYCLHLFRTLEEKQQKSLL